MFDIHVATTVSKMWQYAGMNPGLVCGKKSVTQSKYKPEMGDIVGELPPNKEGEKRFVIKTSEMIRGDKLTPGFLSPYNTELKRHLLGVMAPNFIKSKSEYVIHYYNTKERLSQSERLVDHVKKGGKAEQIPWKDVTKGHRSDAAKRKMVKMFLMDLYAFWREFEGLSVRKPYAEEFLGKVHTHEDDGRYIIDDDPERPQPSA